MSEWKPDEDEYKRIVLLEWDNTVWGALKFAASIACFFVVVAFVYRLMEAIVAMILRGRV